ncbi:hypothetical protein [Spiroplasma monobiae]|uniref:Uncharacterized protein n=1 Tax=Spiroplasma monobiae MQ-1 TaxID=1336748 RepID=A0A2K9LUH4_SPISQ|nr:hypothetical protein [Spiroplasma monobiae]AUM62699.1 hypothetical protein SMONO_v1c04500 [Spiroplasma monobiae MQ-1]
MKKIKYITILLFSLLIGLTILFIANITNHDEIKVEEVDQNYIYFKVKYDIQLENKTLLPVKIKNDIGTNNSKELLETSGFQYLETLFDIESNTNLNKSNTIYFYPKEHIEVVRTSRFDVDIDFFLVRGVSENVSIKSVDIFNDQKKSYEDCMNELKNIYKGTFNAEFYSKAIPKLIY